MTSETKFNCTCCGEVLSNLSVNREFTGYCFNGKGEATNNLMSNLDGPHICTTCIEKLFECEPKTY